jgi:hypothetical protein
MSSRPTSVEPVKESLRSRGSLMGAAGKPGVLEDLREHEHRQRRLLGGLDDRRAAGGDGRADLAGAHRHGEVPGRDEQARPDGLAHDDDAAGALVVDLVGAVDAQRLAGEPVEEVRGVEDLRLGLRDGLAHLHRHEEGEVVGLGDERLVGAAQDLAALPRRRRGELRLRGDRRVERGDRVLDRRVRDLGDRLARGGILDRQRAAARRVAPLAADVELGGDAIEDRLLLRVDCCGAHVRTTVSSPSSSEMATSIE